MFRRIINILKAPFVVDDPGLPPGVENGDGHFELNNIEYVAPFPHCDSFILHAPGTCDCCDHYPRAQADRMLNGIAFTNDSPEHIKKHGLKLCPAVERRPLHIISQWCGNVPQKKGRVNV